MSGGVPVFDVHAHNFLRAEIDQCGAAGPEYGLDDEGVPFFRAGQMTMRNFHMFNGPQGSYTARLELMDELDVTAQLVISHAVTFFYREPIADAVHYNRVRNDAIAEFVAQSPRLFGAATLPLQSPDEAVKELHRATQELGLVATYLGATAGDRLLSDPAYEELWEEHARLGIPAMIHGNRGGGIDSPALPAREQHNLEVVLGYPIDEGMAVAHLLLGGVLERHPGLRIVSYHGGGMIPYQKGRLQHAFETQRAKNPTPTMRPFAELWSQVFFDTALHGRDSLEFLLRVQDPRNVVIGTNFGGWDQEAGLLDELAALGLSDDTIADVSYRNAARLFGILPEEIEMLHGGQTVAV